MWKGWILLGPSHFYSNQPASELINLQHIHITCTQTITYPQQFSESSWFSVFEGIVSSTLNYGISHSVILSEIWPCILTLVQCC